MGKIRKLLKALSGTVSWNLKGPKALNTIKKSIGKKEKQNSVPSSDLKKGLAES
jgi:hypothetical protein